MQMGRIGKELGVDFVISTGDNFYEDGLTGINDPAFEESFSQIYTAEALQTPWYSGKSFLLPAILLSASSFEPSRLPSSC